MFLFFFFFNDTATTEIYTLSLHDALPIWETALTWIGALWDTSRMNCGALVSALAAVSCAHVGSYVWVDDYKPAADADRKSTRLNSSHLVISYAVFCLKKKKKKIQNCSSLP